MVSSSNQDVLLADAGDNNAAAHKSAAQYSTLRLSQQCERIGCGEGQVELTFKPRITAMAAQMRPSTLEQLVDGGRSYREEMLQTKR
jgi:hypothetical protein